MSRHESGRFFKANEQQLKQLDVKVKQFFAEKKSQICLEGNRSIYIDKIRKNDTFLDSDDEIWSAYCFRAENDVVKILQQSGSHGALSELFKSLGNSRAMIARHLKHGAAENRTAEFGAFRIAKDEDDVSGEEICPQQDSAWPELFEAVGNKVLPLLPNLLLIQSNFSADLRGGNHSVDIYSSHTLNSTYEACQIVCFTETNTNNILRINVTYPNLSNKDHLDLYANTVEGANIHKTFQELVDWDKGNIDEFYMNLARLSYCMYRLVPFTRGTASITDWLIRGIAKYHGIELGYRKSNPLSADFEAFLTPDLEKYVQWFCNHAFESKPMFSQNLTMK